MPAHHETRVLPYTVEQMFDLVADIERYPEFLPWCVACRIKSRESPACLIADLAVGFKMVREKFTSRVTFDRPNSIVVEYIDGPFSHLTNIWRFRAAADGAGTEVDFSLDFEFRSKILQNLIGLLFEEAVRRMVAAFEKRAAAIYRSAV